jgi:cell fate (sporulation/competence/biofilm development) regulator YlbF (YheA/YmcA/DUF963 family)
MAESNLTQTALRLGAVLRQTNEMTRYLEEKKMLDADDEALRMIEKQASLQRAMRTKQIEGPISIADLEELKEIHDAVSSKVSSFLGAQQEAKRLLAVVNGEISRLCGFAFDSLARQAACC